MTKEIFDKLAITTESLIGDFGCIPEERKHLLDELCLYIVSKLGSKSEINLVFICTHNSRRSHMAQLWAQAAAYHYHVPHINTFSGGTQKTAFNSAAVHALKDAGFKFSLEKEGKNPKYKVEFTKSKDHALICFSKLYDHKKNPKENFVAVMTCSEADEACPVISGASYRTTISYDDPKKFDGKENQLEAYQERSKQIGREMLYVFSRVASMMR